MNTSTDDDELLLAYRQADAPARRELFPSFLKALKAMAANGRGADAALNARRAVAPELDYTSLLQLRRFMPTEGPGERLRLAVLGGPTTTQLCQLLATFLWGAGIEASIYEGPYGLFRQEVLGPGPELDRFKPRLVFIAAEARDVTAAARPGAASDEAVEAEARNWASLWDAAHKRWGCQVIQNDFAPEPWPVLGHLAAREPGSERSFLRRLNLALGRIAPAHVAVHPVSELAAELGAAAWFDPRFYFEAKLPCSPEALVAYAHSVMSLARGLVGRGRRVLALDLDNTLWGGIVGDAGPGGIVFGQGSGAGEAFLRFQQYAKALRERGIVLAVCSKNDEAKAKEPFEKRRDMPLKLEDFSGFKANWENKADNLRELARSLNLGLDAFVLVDDNPAERALVRRFLPEVAVPDLPEDPSGYVEALARHRFFESGPLTAEDRARAAYYQDNAKREALKDGALDIDAFLRSLDMRAAVEPVGPLNIERAAQLINKSNQFNLTTRRRSVAELEGLAKDGGWTTLTISLSDAVGDNGLISVLLGRKAGDVLEIDTWLMSCRVLQRGVEQFALNELAESARKLGCRRLTGAFIPTEKNGLVKDHYERLGFRSAGGDGTSTLWELDLNGFAGLKTYIRKGQG